MIRSMIVGSLPRPAWLAAPAGVFAKPLLDDPATRAEAEDDAVRLAVRAQIDAGLDAVTDGEQRRRHYIWGFCEGLTGIDFTRSEKITARGGRYQAETPGPVVTGPVRRTKPVLVDALRSTIAAADGRPVKVTLPGPMTVVDTLADRYYGDRRRFAFEIARILNEEACELAEAGAAIIQFDEPCFNIYLDDVEEWGIDALQTAAADVRAKTAVHICYGYGVPVVLAWKTSNTDWSHYHRTLPLLADSTIDQISIELAASGVDPAVVALAAGKEVAAGVIDVGTDEVETPETVAARIGAIAAHIDRDRLWASTDCGMVPRQRAAADAKMRALAAGVALVNAG